MNLTERLDKHLQSIKEQENYIEQIDRFCKKLGFTKGKKLILDPVHTYTNFNKGNYNHQIVYDAGDKVISYEIYKLDSDKPFDKFEWKVYNNNLNNIFKEIKKELDGHE